MQLHLQIKQSQILMSQIVQEDKPAVTFKDENAAALADKTEPKTDELKGTRGQTSRYIQR